MLCFVLQHVYIPIIFSSGVDYIDAPTPYMMGLHSGVDTSAVTMDGVSCNIKMRFSVSQTFVLVSSILERYISSHLFGIKHEFLSF
jgi:hypothetical protein